MTGSKDQLVCNRHGITPLLLERWLSKYEEDPVVKKFKQDTLDLQYQVYVKFEVKEMHFDIPKELTRDVFIQISTKVQACTRHEVYNRVQKVVGKFGGALPDNEYDQILQDVSRDNIEGFRASAFKLYNVPIPKGQNVLPIMLKAFLMYSTQVNYTTRSTKDAEGDEEQKKQDGLDTATKSRWNARLQVE